MVDLTIGRLPKVASVVDANFNIGFPRALVADNMTIVMPSGCISDRIYQAYKRLKIVLIWIAKKRNTENSLKMRPTRFCGQERPSTRPSSWQLLHDSRRSVHPEKTANKGLKIVVTYYFITSNFHIILLKEMALVYYSGPVVLADL